MSEPQHDIYRMAVEQGCNWPGCHCPIPTVYCKGLTQSAAKYKSEKKSPGATTWQSSQTGQRTPATNFDWEITQAIIHLKNAASVTDSNRAHLLLSAVQIAKGVRESE